MQLIILVYPLFTDISLNKSHIMDWIQRFMAKAFSPSHSVGKFLEISSWHYMGSRLVTCKLDFLAMQ